MKKIWVACVVLLGFYILFPTAAFGQYEGLFKPAKELYTGQTFDEATAVGDVNGDGFNDVVAASTFYFDPEWDYKVMVWIQNTSVTPHSFYPPVRYDIVNPRNLHPTLFIEDMNEDGLNDVVVETSDGFGILYQDGSGNLMNIQNFTPTYTKYYGAETLAVGDFNNDGRQDAVISSGDPGNNYLEVFLQNNANQFTTSDVYNRPIGADHIGVGRLNNDTLDDIVIGSGSSIAVFLQNAGGTMDAAVQYNHAYHHSWMAVGDLNDDGRDDVVINYIFGDDFDLGFFYQNAAGTFDPPVYWGDVSSWHDWAIEIADVNRDGRNDIILEDSILQVLYQTSSGGMETDYVTYPTLGSQHDFSFDFGDIDDDGWSDVVFSQTGNDGVTVQHGWNNTTALVLSYPNGGQTYNVASGIQIRYEKYDPTEQIDEVDISYSLNGGQSWSIIEAGLDALGTEGYWNYYWTAPLTASDNCMIRVHSMGMSDQSYYAFSLVDDGVQRLNLISPSNGDTLVIGSSFPISWENSGDIANVKIEYSIDNGTNWTTVIDSYPIDVTYLWTVPNTPSMQCKMRISDASDNSPIDTMDGVFRIADTSTEVINVISPNGGESLTAGSTHNILWNSNLVTQVVLEYSTDNGTNWTIIATVASTGSYTWTVPNIPSPQCLVRIRDASDSIPSDQSNSVFAIVASGGSNTLTLGTPNGGEVFCIGKVADITWSTFGTVGNIRIRYSTNNGTSWKSVVNSTPNDGSYSWTIPNTPSFQCLVKISEAADGDPSDTSDKVFSIVECGASISVTSPKGGETWKVGSVHNITWVSGSNVGANIKIQYSSDNQATWKTVVSSTPNDGTYSWKIPNTPSSTCNVKVSDAADGTPSNTSYGSFAIITGSEVPVIELNHYNFYYGSVRNSTAKTGIQTLVVDNSGSGILQWQASVFYLTPNYGSDINWLRINNTTGVQSGKVEVSVETGGMAAGTYTGGVRVVDPNASNSPQILNVTLIIYETGIDADPFGYIETPADGAAVMSSIPVTGWALDDTGIEKVTIWRNAVPGESGQEVYIGDALLVEGQRPDVEQAFPTYPLSYKAGWGYMLLTNFLPNGGNGTFTLHVYAKAYGGRTLKLGSRTITCDNAHAVKPFGAIDTPVQGGEAFGNKYRNHGWVLTPMPNQVPVNGSTINVYVDGVSLGHPTYHQHRKDVADLFPGYANSNNAGGYFDLDTTAYENGVHVISWMATDNAGNADGIGSRYFTIQNTGYSRQTSGKTNHPAVPVPGTHRPRPGFAEMLNIPVEKTTSIEATFGYKEGEKPVKMTADKEGMIFITLPQDRRVTLNLNHPEAMEHSAYLVFQDRLRPLPAGAILDTQKGIFYWQPGPASFGKYPLVFIFKDRTGKSVKRQVTIQIVPK